MLTIHGRATSSNVQAVMWLVGELRLPYERIDRGHLHGGLEDPGFRALTPHGLVPVLEDDGQAVWESCAINRYLAARYGRGTSFWPEDAGARAKTDMWAEWAKTTLCPAFTGPIFWARVRTAARDRNEAALTASIDRFETALRLLEDQLGANAYVAGDAISLADIVVGHLLFRYFDIDIPRATFPVVRAYYDRLSARPAYREHVMVSYDPLRVEDA